MSAAAPWFQRRFTFDFPVEVYPDVIERLRGVPARIEAKIRGLSPQILTRREREGTWSIQENIGHLIDLESLGFQRLKDYLAGANEMSAADLTNRRTNEAGHNQRAIADLLNDFSRDRRDFVRRLDALSPQDFARITIHPRLKAPMRLVDWLYFVAAHDDYHLTRMTELIRLFTDHSPIA